MIKITETWGMWGMGILFAIVGLCAKDNTMIIIGHIWLVGSVCNRRD